MWHGPWLYCLWGRRPVVQRAVRPHGIILLTPSLVGLLRNPQIPAEIPYLLTPRELNFHLAEHPDDLFPCVTPSAHPDLLIAAQSMPEY